MGFFINKKVTTDAKVVLRSICFVDTHCCLLCTCPLSMCFRWQFAIYFQDYANPWPRPGMLIIYTACWVIFQAFVICWFFFFKLNFQILFSKCYHSIKQIGSKSRPTFIWPLTWSKLFAKIISRRQADTCMEIVMFRIYWLQKSLKDHLNFVADSY